MKLPEFILNYALIDCNLKATDKDIFKFVKMLFENTFDKEETDYLIKWISAKYNI